MSDFIERQVQRLLHQAEEALDHLDWVEVRGRAEAILRLDPGNVDAQALFDAATRGGGSSAESATRRDADRSGGESAPPNPAPASQAEKDGREVLPTSFVGGRYQVQRFLGEGGKKRVYLAHDEQLDRDVAFALLKSDGLDLEGLARIRREAQAMGRLGDHPHIVTVFDIGDEAGQPYIVSQYMAGGDLAALIAAAEEHRLPIEDALRIADQVCQALEHAHANGVIHRDLKPGNVWLTADGTAKLGDFGLAIALNRSRLTQAGMMVGTVSYMSPEQALGHDVTARSDLYSLGAMFYELVTGRPPFVGDESVAIISQHLNTPPVSPSWHVPDVPPGLETLILRLLEKDPEKRPASAGEIRHMLVSLGTASPYPSPLSAGEGTDSVGASAPSSWRGRASGASPAEDWGEAPAPDPTYRRVFIGRENELRQLQQAFDRAISGEGSITMVVGEPGIGKTALCEQMATYAAVRGGKTLVGHSYEEGSLSIPYLAFVEALCTYVLGREPDKLKSELGTGAAEVARIISEIRDRVEVELRPAGDPEDDRWRLLQAVTGFLRNASAVHPLLIVLEDLHWADRGTMDLLLHLARNLEGARLLIVGNYRDVEVDRTHPLSGALAELRRIGSFERIPLRGLTVDEVHRMMSQIRGQEVSWSRAEAIYRQTEGNPLFVQEVLRYLVEEGLVVREGGRYARTDGTDPEAGIPEGLRDVIGKRLSRLSQECNRLLTVAAVIGREFSLDVLVKVARLDEDEVLTPLEEGLKIGILEEQQRVGGVLYRFSHAMFRQTLYEELSAARRIRLHQEVGRALEEIHARRLEDHAPELAEHFSYSSYPSDLAKAVEYGERAARRALSVYAYGEAARLLGKAIEVQEVLDPDDKARRCDLLLALAEALLPTGEHQRVYDEIAEEAFGLADALGRKESLAQACRLGIEGLHRGGAAVAREGQGPIRDVYHRWTERIDRCADPETPLRVLADIALGTDVGGATSAGRAYSRQALQLARRLQDQQMLYEAGQRVMRANWTAAGFNEVLQVARGFATLSRTGVSTRPLGRVMFNAAMILLAAGQREIADGLLREVQQLASRTRDAEVGAWALLIDAEDAMLRGELETSVAEGTQADEAFAAAGLARPGALIPPLLYLGRVDEAAAVALRRQRSYLVECQAVSGEPSIPSTLAELLRPESPFADPETPTQDLSRLLAAAVLVQDRTTAGRLAGRLGGLSATSNIGYLHPTARHLGAAAALLGDYTKAHAEYQRALDWATKIRHRPEIALTRFQLAELLLDEGNSDQPSAISTREALTADKLRVDALEHLDFAIKEFESMKMAPSLVKALALGEQQKA